MSKLKPRFIHDLRSLTREDMAKPLAPVMKAISPDRIRHTHHRVAMLIAAGHRPHEVAKRCGYTLSYLSALAGTPAIKDLVDKYADKIRASAIEEAVEEMQVGQSVLAMAQRQRLERLEEADYDPSKAVPLRELNAICADGEDRYGTPRKSANFNFSANFAEELEKALFRSNQTSIDVTPEGSKVPEGSSSGGSKATPTTPEGSSYPYPQEPNISQFRRRV